MAKRRKQPQRRSPSLPRPDPGLQSDRPGLSAVAEPPAPLDVVRQALARERAAALERDQAVTAARDAGATWTEIARVLEVSPQAVQQRYGRSTT